MKYCHPDFRNYVIDDENDQRSWWSPEKEKAEMRRNSDRNIVKRGMWLTYGGIAVAILYLVIVVFYLIDGGTTRAQLPIFTVLFVCWAFLAALNYYEYKTARARVAAENNTL